MTGALAPYAEGFRKELSRQGYSPWTAPEHMYLMSDLSRWLDGRDLSPAAAEFGADRGVPHPPGVLPPGPVDHAASHRSPAGLPAWAGRRSGAGAAVPASPAERLLVEFAAYLATERGLCPATIAAYRYRAGLFLSTCAPEPAVEGCGLERLEPRQISAFLLAECAHRSIGSTKNMAIALRVLMRFLYLEGYTAASLAGAVPRAIPWRDSGRSRALEPGQVSRLLASCDRRNPAGLARLRHPDDLGSPGAAGRRGGVAQARRPRLASWRNHRLRQRWPQGPSAAAGSYLQLARSTCR